MLHTHTRTPHSVSSLCVLLVIDTQSKLWWTGLESGLLWSTHWSSEQRVSLLLSVTFSYFWSIFLFSLTMNVVVVCAGGGGGPGAGLVLWEGGVRHGGGAGSAGHHFPQELPERPLLLWLLQWGEILWLCGSLQCCGWEPENHSSPETQTHRRPIENLGTKDTHTTRMWLINNNTGDIQWFQSAASPPGHSNSQ